MESEWIKADPEFSSVPGIDPTVEWALSKQGGLEYFFPSQGLTWMPILVQFNKGKEISASEFESGMRFFEGEDTAEWVAAVRVPRARATSPLSKDPVQFCTALVTRKFFELVWKNEKVRANYLVHVARVTLGLPLDDDSLPVKSSGDKR